MAITLHSISIRSEEKEEEDMAETLSKRWKMNLKVKRFGNDGDNLLPAYADFGFFMRGLGSIPEAVIKQQPGWLLGQENKEKGSIPMAIMSDLTAFSGTGAIFRYGYIFYSPSETPNHMVPIKLICAFPSNAVTAKRKGNHGCTSNIEKIVATAGRFCNEMGINHLEDWIGHFWKTELHSQCPFDMRDEKYAHERFKTVVEANQWAQFYYSNRLKNNEVLAEAYDDQHPKRLPIQAIFIDSHQEESRNEMDIVMKLQHELYEVTDRKVPIVIIRFPSLDDESVILEIVNFPRSPHSKVYTLTKEANNDEVEHAVVVQPAVVQPATGHPAAKIPQIVHPAVYSPVEERKKEEGEVARRRRGLYNFLKKWFNKRINKFKGKEKRR